ncbi:GNAT family N-acetyltransferase [Enterococcus sp. UD-01]|jgi:RimJ/RimL family protein N-acetyltransferase|uniref:GNAT family N-acetyltransferase n=1 Tax=Enterococcus sp. UD-01 TaxID=3373911 RepID=UPI0038328F83
MATYLKKAEQCDLTAIMAIITEARLLLQDNQVPQWQNGEGPSETVIKQDIRLGRCYVLVHEESIVGLGVISTESEPPYEALNSWQVTSNSYAVFHRIALGSAFQGQGLAVLLINQLLTAARLANHLDIRIDTHPKNKAMQRLIKKTGFSFQGEILLPVPDGERYAYQLILK